MAGIRLEWAQFGDFDSFDVLRSESPMDINALPSPIVTGLSTMFYVDPAVVEGATYYYRIRTWRDNAAMLSDEIKSIAANAINLVSFNDADNATQFFDEINNNYWQGYGSAKTLAGALVLNGVPDYVQSLNNIAINGTGDFTLEFSIKLLNNANATIIDMRPPSTNGPYIYLGLQNGAVLYYHNAADRIVSDTRNWAIQFNTIALVRKSSVTSLYINGIKEGDDYIDTYMMGESKINIGKHAYISQGLSGQFRLLRILPFALY